MRILVALLLLVAVCARGQGNTNIIGAWIEPDGFTLNVHIGGTLIDSFGTDVQFYNGFLTNPATNYTSLNGTQKCTLTVTSSGWNSDGTSRTLTRVLNATKIRRKPYPSNSFNWAYGTEAVVSNVQVRIALSDFVYAGETISMSTRTGWIVNTNSGVEAAVATGMSVTNLSELTFGKDSEPSLNWAHPGMRRWTNSTEYIYLDGGHWSGIAGIKVEATEGVNTQTVWAVHSSVRPWRGPKHGLWVAGIPTGTFSNYAMVRCDYIVYPMIGTNVFDTRLDRWTGLTPLPAAQTNFWDRFNAFTNFGVVALTAGATPVITNGPVASVHSDHYFSSFNAAFNAMAATNFHKYGIAEAIGTVYGRNGVTNFSGGSLSVSNAARSWSIIRNYPAEVLTITNKNGNADISDCVKFEGDTDNGGGLFISVPAAVSSIFSGMGRMWLDNLTIDSPTTILWFTVTNIWLTDVNVVRLGQGMIPNGTVNTSFSARDVDLSGINTAVWLRYGCGLLFRGRTNNSFQLTDTRTTPGAPFSAHTILTDSTFLVLGGAGNVPLQYGINSRAGLPTNSVLHGYYSENCLFEATNNYSQTALSLWSYSDITNVVIRNWTVMGARQFTFYNSDTNSIRSAVRIYNNIFSVSGYANDLTPQNNPWLTNSIGPLHQVGSSGNIHWFPTGSPSHNWPDFNGLNTVIPNEGFKLATNFVKVQNNQGYISAITPGLGDYRLLSDNFLWKVQTHQPDAGFDIEGKSRSSIDPPGAYVDGQLKKGAFF